MLNRLNDRERLFVIAGVGFIVLFLLFTLMNRIRTMRSELSESVSESRSNFSEMDRLIKDFNFYKNIKSGEENDPSQIYAKLDPIMVKYSLKEKVSTMRDSSNLVGRNYKKITIDMSLRSVILNDVFKMIYDIEINKQINCKVEYLNFKKPFANKEIYDVNMKLSAYSKTGKSNG